MDTDLRLYVYTAQKEAPPGGGTTVLPAIVPHGEVWKIIAGRCWHDDPVARDLRWQLLTPSGGVQTWNGPISRAQFAVLTIYDGVIGAPLTIQAGYTLQAQAASLAATEILYTLLYYYKRSAPWERP